MKLRELINFLSCYEDLLDAEVETDAIPLGLRHENLLITEPATDLFGGVVTNKCKIHFDNCFDGVET